MIVETSTCADVQYLDVNNTRMSSEKYKGYSCLIHLLIPQPIRASAIPALSIKNPGEKTTTITQQRGLLFDMGPSSLTLEGTLFLVELMNSKMRMFKADIQSGAIRMLNMTFEQVVGRICSCVILMPTTVCRLCEGVCWCVSPPTCTLLLNWSSS